MPVHVSRPKLLIRTVWAEFLLEPEALVRSMCVIPVVCGGARVLYIFAAFVVLMEHCDSLTCIAVAQAIRVAQQAGMS